VIFLLSLLLCWEQEPTPDLLGFWVASAERHVVEWVVCPCDPGVPCPQHILCPIYNPFQWQMTFTGYAPQFERTDCANETNSVCYFKHPVVEDWSGNVSVMPMIPNPMGRGCP